MATQRPGPPRRAGVAEPERPDPTPLPSWERELRRMAVLQRREITARRRPVRRGPKPLRVPGL